MMGKDCSETFLASLRKQEMEEERLNRSPPKPSVKQAARMFVMTANQPLDDIEIDLNSPGFFDELFYNEVALNDAKRLQKELKTDSSVQLPSPNSTDSSFIDNQYFGESLQQTTDATTPITSDNTFSHHSRVKESSDMGMIDSQYFEDDTRKSSSNNLITKTGRSAVSTSMFSMYEKDFSHVDMQYFATESSSAMSSDINSIAGQDQEDAFPNEYVTSESTKLKESNQPVSSSYDVAQELLLAVQSQDEGVKKHSNDKSLERRKKGEKSIRKKSKHGVDTIRSYLPDFDTKPSYEVVDMLMDNIVFQDEKLICIDKPYSLATQGGPGVHHSVYKYLSDIAKRLHYEGSLHLCHRLDKDTSGVLLIAKGEEQATKMKRRFEQKDIEKKYLAITFGVPKPATGIIDIPIATESLVKEYYRSILLPATTKTRRRGVHPAQTEYKVLRHNETAALVELQPLTGRKHQLRVHLADGLGTPILGDHKYSHRDKLAPQRLTKDILTKFRIEQSQVRNIPMHLHARRLLLPGYFPNGRGLVLSAMIPKYFAFSIKRLKFFR